MSQRVFRKHVELLHAHPREKKKEKGWVGLLGKYYPLLSLNQTKPNPVGVVLCSLVGVDGSGRDTLILFAIFNQ